MAQKMLQYVLYSVMSVYGKNPESRTCAVVMSSSKSFAFRHRHIPSLSQIYTHKMVPKLREVSCNIDMEEDKTYPNVCLMLRT